RLVGWRVNQIYDVDNKTYLFRMQGTGAVEKVTLLMESGTRFHTTRFEWPKNMAPSGFSMKLRKHLKNKRLEKIQQLGGDRIVDFQFGTGDAAYHVILELYDRGNVILTDYELTTLYILRPHTEGENLRFAMREKYPVERAKQATDELKPEALDKLLENAKNGDYLRQILTPNLDCGPAVIEHILLSHGLDNHVIKKEGAEETADTEEKPDKGGKKQRKKQQSAKLEQKPFDMVNDLPTLRKAVQCAHDLIIEGNSGKTKGYIIQVKEEKPAENGKVEFFFRNIEFHPYPFAQFQNFEKATFESFMEAADEFYSTQESQKIDMKTLHQEREALKKLSNVKNDHAKRLEELTKVQDVDRKKAELITSNQSLVDNAIRAVQSAIASQLSWPDIHELVKEAQANGDPVASSIKQLKLETNHISLALSDPYDNYEDEDLKAPEVTVVDVDLALSAWANARRYYDMKRSAAQKEKKTVDASQKALKSAERKTQQTLKEVRTISNIVKARKVFWFEKFYWFISSENYLVIGGRDAQQNELIVKRYMRPKDIYVHAEIQGASSVIIQNPSGEDIPPKTLLEAGSMAISYSVAWDAKVVTNSYWVNSDQVSKTAPTGEYLATGSFMIRGKKNFLPSCHLTMGLSLLFKLEDSFIEAHLGERKVRNLDDDLIDQNVKETEVEHDLLSDGEDNETDAAANVSEQSSNTEITGFPNTEVTIEHDTGRITVRSNSLNPDNEATEEIEEEIVEKLPSKPVDEETTIILAGPSRKKQVSAKKTKEDKARAAAKQEAAKQEVAPVSTEPKNPSQVKRGQKGKLKKMKQKYKDQDDEEREIRMMILKSSGKEKPQATADKVVEKSVAIKEFVKPEKSAAPKNPVELEDADDLPAGGDVDILNSLTGQPHEGDELLFAIPVVAPYQALQNYKFKVKLTPGTGKRGKAAKLALNIFAKEKGCNTREKDLLKSIKEESMARNIPGKVKLSAPQLQKYHK
ncbi:hypothetical protein KR084_009067, partial [Drosophila pseudotakahashii]